LDSKGISHCLRISLTRGSIISIGMSIMST
jgi:hypothetical protein